MNNQEKLEKIRKIIKDAKLKQVERNGYKNYVVHVTLTDGKEIDIRVKNYELEALVEDAGVDNFVVNFEIRVSKETNNEFECFVISLTAINYELLAFPSREVMAMLNLRILKK